MLLNTTQRVKSLESENPHWQKERITRLNLKSKEHSVKKLRRNSIITTKHYTSNVKLPEISSRKNLQKGNTRANTEVSEVVGKKLVTEIGEDDSKTKGL